AALAALALFGEPPASAAPVACGAWQPVRAPKPVFNDYLVSIDGTSASDIWGVGLISGGSGPPVILHWDGAEWSDAAQQGVNEGSLEGVVALASDNAWAIGNVGVTPVAMHWDGTIWNRASLPMVGNTDYMYGIAASSSSDVWAVGSYTDT